jgi:ribosome biogenesis GTPase A
MSIQWYPGHIAKLERELQDLLKRVDVVVEVRDARMPLATTHPTLLSRVAHKPTLLLLNKADLADPQQTQRWVQALTSEHIRALPFEAKLHPPRQQVLNVLQQLGKAAIDRWVAKGLNPRAVRVAVLGMPNVGKSTIINQLIGKKRAQTGHKAGVTRVPRWIRLHPAVELLDTPGIIPPRLDTHETGMLLATAHSVGEAAFDEGPVAEFLLARVQQHYPGLLAEHYQATDGTSLAAIATARGWLGPGGEPDLKRAAQGTLTDFRHGRWGHLTLEVPG